MGFPIRKSADQSLFAAPHGLSQRTTSFIASQRQGIHRIPLRHLIALIINIHHQPRPRQSADESERASPFTDMIERPVLLQTCPGTCGQATPTAGDARSSFLAERSATETCFLFTMSDISNATAQSATRNSGATPMGPQRTSWLKAELAKSRAGKQARSVSRCRKASGPGPADHSKNGGARRDRTDDLKLAKLALSQLSYGPKQRRSAPGEARPEADGGPGRTRTSDLTLIKRAL